MINPTLTTPSHSETVINEILFKSINRDAFFKCLIWVIVTILLMLQVFDIQLPLIPRATFFILIAIGFGLYYLIRYFFIIEVSLKTTATHLSIEMEGKFNLHYKHFQFSLNDIDGYAKYNINRDSRFRYIVLYLKSGELLRINISKDKSYVEVVKILESLINLKSFDNQTYLSRVLRTTLILLAITVFNFSLSMSFNYLMPDYAGSNYIFIKIFFLIGFVALQYRLLNKQVGQKIKWEYLLKNNLNTGIIFISLFSILFSFIYKPIVPISNLSVLTEINDPNKLRGPFFSIQNDSVFYSPAQTLFAQSNKKFKNPNVALFVKEDRYDIFHHNVVRIKTSDMLSSAKPIIVFLDQRFRQTIFGEKHMSETFIHELNSFKTEKSYLAKELLKNKPNYFKIIYSDTLKRFSDAKLSKEINSLKGYYKDITIIEPYWDNFDSQLTENRNLLLLIIAGLSGFIIFMGFTLPALPLRSQRH